MRRMDAILVVALLALCSPAAWGIPSRVYMDLSALGGADFQLQVALHDNSPVIGDSRALIDNVIVGSSTDDFETGALGGFNRSLNPASVNTVAGSLNGAGSFVLRIDEDPLVTPTITFRDYLSPDSSLVIFDVEMIASDTAGFWGRDELVFSLVNPTTLAPLVPGLTGLGDVLAIDATGFQHTSEVSITAIPAPAALLLGLIGAAGVRILRRRTW